LDAFAGHIRLFTAEKIYQVVAEAFKENIKLVYEDEANIPLYFPPSLSIFLSLYRSSHDLSRTIDDFRKEFAGVRQDFRSLAEKLTRSRTLQERIEIKHQLGDALKLVKIHYQLNDDSLLETVLGFAPEVLNPLSNPTDPSKYSAKLLTMPITWIKDWWRKRPLRHIFDLRKRLYQITDYENLASEVLDTEFGKVEDGPGVLFDFNKHYDEYLSLYKRQS